MKETTLDTKDNLKTLKDTKSTSGKIMKVGGFCMGPKHRPPERTAIYYPTTQNLLTDESEILKATLKYNTEVLTKNKLQPQDLKDVIDKKDLHNKIVTSTEKKFSEPLDGNTYSKVIRNL